MRQRIWAFVKTKNHIRGSIDWGLFNVLLLRNSHRLRCRSLVLCRIPQDHGLRNPPEHVFGQARQSEEGGNVPRRSATRNPIGPKTLPNSPTSTIGQ